MILGQIEIRIEIPWEETVFLSTEAKMPDVALF